MTNTEYSDHKLVMDAAPEDMKQAAESFYHDLEHVLFTLVGESPAHAAVHSKSVDKQDLAKVLQNCLHYAQTAEWRGQSTELEFGALIYMTEFYENSAFFNAVSDFKDYRQLCSSVLSMIEARNALHSIDGEVLLQRDYLYCWELALLTGYSDETIRLAQYQDGEHKLETKFEERLVDRKEAKRWLQVKGLYAPTRIVEEYVFHPQWLLKDTAQFKFFIENQLKSTEKSWSDVREYVSSQRITTFEKFVSISKPDDASVTDLNWFEETSAIGIGKLINKSPKWLFESVIEIRHESALNALEKLPDIEPDDTDQEFTIPSEIFIDGPSIRSILRTCPWIDIHPEQMKPNKKMDGYLTEDGITFTHEHNGKRQFLWIPMSVKLQKDESLITKPYLASALNKDGNYGRHSGLLKYEAINFDDLLRVQIRTAADIRLVLSAMNKKENRL